MDFLQSGEWRRFQEAVGQRTFLVSSDNFHASIIEHRLPMVGRYFYIPRGDISVNTKEIINLAKKEKAGWIRVDSKVEPSDLKGSTLIIKKAPHDMQPREVFIIDIAKTEEDLLAGMKAKTRYNIKLAQKHNVSVKVISNTGCHPERSETESKDLIKLDSSTTLGMTKYLDEFLRLVKITAERDKIVSHSENYYRQMFEVISSEIIKLYVAEYEGKVIAANLVVFYGDIATYLHGASDNEYRNVMAPYLLQWRAIQDAKKMGCVKYDFGGVKTKISNFIRRGGQISNEIPISKFQKVIKNLKFKIKNSSDSWSGITKFKMGFSPNTQPTQFLGSYDIVLNPFKYNFYRFLQKVKSFL